MGIQQREVARAELGLEETGSRRELRGPAELDFNPEALTR